MSVRKSKESLEFTATRRRRLPRLPEFEGALSLAAKRPAAPQPDCLDDPIYTDFVSPPPAEIARKMCADCPLLLLCRESALRERPAWGVQGGIVWVFGQQYHLRRKAAAEKLAGEESPESIDLAA